MNSRHLLRRLGFSAHDRVVVLHADDIGMCAATVEAYARISASGLLSAASAMVPCSWFPQLVEQCRQTASADMGIHLTLTCEWAGYRWGPVLGAAASSLCGDAGYFHRNSMPVQRAHLGGTVSAELEAQIKRAQTLGLAITHLDSHMFTLLHPSLWRSYCRLAQQYSIPAISLPLGGHSMAEGMSPAGRRALLEFDAWAQLPLDSSTHRLETARRLLGELPEGLSYFISHPATDSPELRAIAPDWESRVADFRLHMDDRWATAVEAEGVRLIGISALRLALREASDEPQAPGALELPHN